MALFSITRTNHPDCLLCEAMAKPAASTARATGSTQSGYSDGQHGARVQRVTRAS